MCVGDECNFHFIFVIKVMEHLAIYLIPEMNKLRCVRASSIASGGVVKCHQQNNIQHLLKF